VNWPRFILYCFISLTIFFGASLVARVVKAHTITWPDGQSFTFEISCCDKKDCDALPLSAITEVRGGYMVDYWRTRGNPPRLRHYKGFVPFGSYKIKFNPFADRIMGCDSATPGEEQDTLSPRCIYPLQPAM
jgi:hypothetical protein